MQTHSSSQRCLGSSPIQFAPQHACGLLHRPRVRHRTSLVAIRHLRVVHAADGAATQTQSATDEVPEQPLHLILPASWEMQMDEMLSRYTHMDERLDAVEHELVEMVREMRTGNASLTGGITSISQGTPVVTAVTSITVPPASTTPPASPAPAPAQPPATPSQPTSAAAESPAGAVTPQPTTPAAAPAPPTEPPVVSPEHATHAKGVTTGGAVHSGGLVAPGGPVEKLLRKEHAHTAAQTAHAAQDALDRSKGHGGLAALTSGGSDGSGGSGGSGGAAAAAGVKPPISPPAQVAATAPHPPPPHSPPSQTHNHAPAHPTQAAVPQAEGAAATNSGSGAAGGQTAGEGEGKGGAGATQPPIAAKGGAAAPGAHAAPQGNAVGNGAVPDTPAVNSAVTAIQPEGSTSASGGVTAATQAGPQTLSPEEGAGKPADAAVQAARMRLLSKGASAVASSPPALRSTDGDSEGQQQKAGSGNGQRTNNPSTATKGATSGGGSGSSSGGSNGKEAEGSKDSGDKGGSTAPLLGRESLYGFNRLQAALTELSNSGYIESVKQLRETLLIQEWDLTNRHLAKRRGVSMFERYIAERDLVQEIGGYAVISALYEDPDALDTLLPNDRMRMLARSMIEECLNTRRQAVYELCTATAKEMASLTSSGVSSRMLLPLKQGVLGAVFRLLSIFKATFLPWLRFIPFIR